MATRKSSDITQIGLRLRESVRQRLLREAQRNRRPLNTELARRLEQSLDGDAVKSIEAVAADLASTWGRIRKAAG